VTLPEPKLSGPAAIAFSGGGDSTAMVHAFRDHPQITHVFIIDHALRAGSAEEAKSAARFARDLGYIVQIDRWQNDGPTTGIQVKARQYRYRALGQMCRAAGLSHLLTAHTADDQAETLLMRLQRQTGWRGLAGMPDMAFAPLWPALAGVTLHRPWLMVSRAALRDYNREYALPFVDDPSNENRDFTRIRARQALRGDPALRGDLLQQQVSMRTKLDQERTDHANWLRDHAKISPQGFIETKAIPPSELLLHILRAVSGTGEPIDAARRAGMIEAMRRPAYTGGTLAGAWVVPQYSSGSFFFTRDMVAVKGRQATAPLREMLLKAGESVLWDGRFYVTAKTQDMIIRPVHGLLSKFRQMPEMKSIFEINPELRATLPAFLAKDKIIGFGAVDNPDILSEAQTARRLHSLFP